MIDGVGSRNGYRDQWQNAINNGQVQEGEETDKTGQVWDAVFTDEKDNGVSVDDFLSLMVAQLRNQDFMNPVDDTQYVTQLAQFATMQQMQEMATYMKTNYVMSLVGKNVTAAKFSISGELQKETGVVEKISLVNNEYSICVNGKQFSLEQIMEIHSSVSADGSEDEEDSVQMDYLLSLIGRTVTVWQRDADGEPMDKLTGVVEKISTEDGKYQVRIDGEWYPLDDVLEVGDEETEELPDVPNVDYPGEIPDVDNPDGSGEVTDVENPGEGGGETTDVENPDEGSGETPDVENPVEGGSEVPDVEKPIEGGEEAPDVESPSDEGEGTTGGLE